MPAENRQHSSIIMFCLGLSGAYQQYGNYYLCPSMLRLIIWLFVIFVVVRVVLTVLLPVLRLTTAVGVQMRRVRREMEEMERRSAQQSQPQPQPRRSVQQDGDYIDYEELR